MHSIINFNKPAGMTSQDAVTFVKKTLRVRKAGHSGTLDPMATGVLLVCLNEATKIARFLLDLGKEYRAVLKLGERTNTFDADGEVVERRGISGFRPESLEAALPLFRGKITQRPPMYSAVKVNGKPLYALARRGIEIDRPERFVEVTRLEVVSMDLPFLVLDIACSKGTYIRSLAEDLGHHLGTGAHLTGLERTAVGTFRSENAVTPQRLIAGDFPLFTIAEALGHLPAVPLSVEDILRFRNGQQIEVPAAEYIYEGGMFLACGSGGAPVGIGVKISNKIKAERVFNLDGSDDD